MGSVVARWGRWTFFSFSRPFITGRASFLVVFASCMPEISWLHDTLVHLKLDVILPFDKGSVPRHFSLSLRELSIEFRMCIAVQLHTLDATIHIALIGVEEAIGSISLLDFTLKIKVELTGNQA